MEDAINASALERACVSACGSVSPLTVIETRMLTCRRLLLNASPGTHRGFPNLLSTAYLDPASVPPSNSLRKSKWRLDEQPHMRGDTRERKHALCRLCGSLTVTVNFSNVPSARLGMWGRCKDGKDFTHHRFVVIAEDHYKALRDRNVAERVRWWSERSQQ